MPPATPARANSARVPFSRRLTLEQLEDRSLPSSSYVPDEILIQYAPNTGDAARAAARGWVNGALAERIHTPAMAAGGAGVLERVHLPNGLSVKAAVAKLEHLPGVAYAEPNWVITPTAVSNDPYYTTGSRLWGMYSNDSPTAVGPAGTANQYGSQAEKAWNDGFTGSKSVAVGIVDEGFQFTHPELIDNTWTNPFDPADGVDNDGNGYVDDVRGWDFYNNDNTIYDGTADDHGTHVAGTIGARGGNGAGVAGVNWDVTLISAKFLGSNGGTTAGAIKALDYLTDLKKRHGINIVASNNSWGGGGYSQGLHDAIIRGAKAGILFVAAAGNGGADGRGDNNDSLAAYPSNTDTTVGTTTESAASYDAVIAVASINSSGALSTFSNYGPKTVDLGAPGESVYSSVPTDGYAAYSGTSMAAPHVTGAVALYASRYPDATAEQIRQAILQSAAPTASLAGKATTGGRLDVHAALQTAPGTSPPVNISVNDVSLAEGNKGTTTFTFTVSLSVVAPAGGVTVSYATADGTATSSGKAKDFTAASGTLTIAAGQSSATFSVAVSGDRVYEPDETFYVNLSNATGGTILDGQGVGTVKNDDRALLADGTPPTANVAAVGLAQARTLLAAAVERWGAAGVRIPLGSIRVAVADLPGSLLAVTSGRTITLDRDAAGFGWFVDRTPGDDREFAPGRRDAAGRMDLLTALMHEAGHVAGLEHDADGVMVDTLAAGVRRTDFGSAIAPTPAARPRR